MYAFPDISRDEVRRVARCSRALAAIVRSAHNQAKDDLDTVERVLPSSVDVPHPIRGGETSLELVPDLPQAKFFSLGAQFVVIRDVCHQDLRFKAFYDLTGSGGKASLAAVLLHRWSSVVGLESSRANFVVAVLARRIVQRIEPPDMLTRTQTQAWRIENTTFKATNWMDGDVVFFDATIFESLDEGVLCRFLQGRLKALQAGSFVVLFTRCSDQLLAPGPFQLIHRSVQHHTGNGKIGGNFTSWLFKTTMHSSDYRVGVFDAPSHLGSDSSVASTAH